MEKSTDPDQMPSSADSRSGSTYPSSAGHGLYILKYHSNSVCHTSFVILFNDLCKNFC